MKQATAEPTRRGAGLAGRLLLAQTLVLLTGGVTAWTIAAIVGPTLFHKHLASANVGATSAQILHTEEAYQSANAISLSLALIAALAVAMAVNVYIASGFNQMAGQLGSVERTRTRLLSDLGHEMRTPVATLEAYLEALEDGIATMDAQTAELLHSQTRRLARLSEDISSVSRAEEGQVRLDLQTVQPASVVAAAVDSVAEAYTAKGVDLLTRVPARPPDLLVDPDRLGQVLGNLLDNALRHTPAGGTVTISATTSGTGGVELSVADSGDGIAAEHLPHVFERFYRVDGARDRAHGGSGIGLAIAKALTVAQGGQLTVTSPGTGHGSTFRILLPANK